jgi:hypothetical protein
MLSKMTGSQFLKLFGRPGKGPTPEKLKQLENDIFMWKAGLPLEMHVDTVQDWSVTNVWILVLLAISFRMQAVFYRALRGYYRALADTAGMEVAFQRQKHVMFELGTIIRRVSVHNLGRLCPLSL